MIEAIMNFFRNLFGKKTEETQKTTKPTTTAPAKKQKCYTPKKLLTFTEQKYFKAIQNAVNENYVLYPQINLATIIERKDEHKYQSELYRNIDFVIFDKEYNPKLLIEINDKTHKEKKRIARDIKVKEICQNANLQLITFWTEYGVNQEYITKRIAEYLK